MLVANLAISAAAVVVFYLLLTRFKLVHDPFSSALLFLFFPLRWFLYRSIGASEPLFILLTLLMLYFLKKDEATKATLLGAFTTLTRIWGIITFPVLIGVWLWNKKLTVRRFSLALPIPASLLLLFSFYAYSLGNFFAYFAVNQALIGIPLQVIPAQAVMAESSSALAADSMSSYFPSTASGLSSCIRRDTESSSFTRSSCSFRYCLCSTGISAGTCSRLRHLRSLSGLTRFCPKSAYSSLSRSRYCVLRATFTVLQFCRLTYCL